MSTISITNTPEIVIPEEISKGAKSTSFVLGITAIQLVVLYALIPVGVEIWRTVVCPGC